MRLFALVVSALALGACADRDRLSAVPVNDTGRASVLGIADARIFASDPETFAAVLQKLRDRGARYYASIGRPAPPENILALSGGGDNGAFGAGLLVGLSESGTRPSFQAVTGISAGALIAPFAFLGSEYDPILKKIATVEQSDIYIKRPFLAALVSDSVNDTTPLKRLIATYMDETIMARIAEEYRRGRALAIVTTDLDAGVQVVWDIGAIAESGHPQALALIQKIMLASAAIPGGFPPVMFDVNVDGVARQEMHVDGGAITQTFLYPASVPVGKLNANSARRARTAYIVRNGHLREDWTEVEKSSIAIALRSVSTLTTSSGIGDLYRIYAITKRDGIAFKLAYIRDDFIEPHPTEFDHDYVAKLFDYGRATAHAGNAWQSEPPGLAVNAPGLRRQVVSIPPAAAPAR
ncbi:MAG TPA: patatin-like phospholipase family protein [Pseudolabrys sp.]